MTEILYPLKSRSSFPPLASCHLSPLLCFYFLFHFLLGLPVAFIPFSFPILVHPLCPFNTIGNFQPSYCHHHSHKNLLSYFSWILLWKSRLTTENKSRKSAKPVSWHWKEQLKNVNLGTVKRMDQEYQEPTWTWQKVEVFRFLERFWKWELKIFCNAELINSFLQFFKGD